MEPCCIVVKLKKNRGSSSRGNVVLDGKLYISGGISTRKPQKSPELISSKTSISGPTLPQILFGHCTIKLNDSTILITGGSSSTSRKVKGWKVILQKPGEFQSIRGFEVIVNNEKEVFILGGNKDKRAIFKLECKAKDLNKCGWKKLPQRLKKGRSFLTAISIPDSVAFELCDHH